VGEVQSNGQFKIVYRSKPLVPNPWSPYLPENKKLQASK